MVQLQEFLKGYKTYIILGVFIVFSLAVGQDPLTADLVVDGALDPDKIQTALLGLAGMTAKAAFDRAVSSKK